MHIRIHLPGALECEAFGEDLKGKDVELTAVEVHPFFYSPDAKPAVAHIESCDINGNVIGRYILVQAGASGTIQLIKRTSCTTRYDREHYPEAVPNEPSVSDKEESE